MNLNQTDKNNDVNFECLDIYYHYFYRSSSQTHCDTGDNLSLVSQLLLFLSLSLYIMTNTKQSVCDNSVAFVFFLSINIQYTYIVGKYKIYLYEL
jgi:hypothetical protein